MKEFLELAYRFRETPIVDDDFPYFRDKFDGQMEYLRATLPKIVCLCGSGRFREAFDEAEFNETLAGNIVLTIGCNTKDIARTPELEHHKPQLDELHLRKIDLCDEVVIVNVDGYIGESTTREIHYALQNNKPVRYLYGEAAANA